MIYPIGSTQKLFNLFERAKKHLDDPQLRFKIDRKRIGIKYSYNSEKLAVFTKQPSKLIGYIDKAGEFNAVKTPPVGLYGLLCELCADAKQTAKSVGETHGMCMFCSKPLTDDRSTEVGYGPQCAETWGLPWGDKLNDEEPVEEFDGDLEDYF